MPHKKILLVDDDQLVRTTLTLQLEHEGYVVRPVESAENAAEFLKLENGIDLVLLDMNMPGMGGEVYLEQLRRERVHLPVIVLTGSYDTDLAVRCIKNGASDFLTKPCEPGRLHTTIQNVFHLQALEERLREVQGEAATESHYDMLYGRSPAMRRVFDQLRILEKSDIGVLLEGPSGTGKELAARALHRRGARSAGPFVAINCGAIPETMLESELFGHEKGSFTGAISARAGCFEQADKGTLFLDEIGEMRPDMQVRLLRALENREVRRLGGTRTLLFDCRVIAATNRDLKERVVTGTFREDLYYRLTVFRLALPTLKERGEDILGLAERFMVEFAARLRKRLQGFDQAAAATLRAYTWPGNVRELRNAIERATLLAQGQLLRAQDLPEEILKACPPLTQVPNPSILPSPYSQYVAPPGSDPNLPAVSVPAGAQPGTEAHGDEILTLQEEEKRIFQRALRLTKGDVGVAANRLGIGRATLYRRMKELGISTEHLEAV